MPDPLSNAEKNWRDQLSHHAADVPNDMFDRINAARLSDAAKTQLKDFESPVPDNMFDRVQTGLGQNNWKEKLKDYPSEISDNAFERVMLARAPENTRTPENTRRPIIGWLGLGLLLFLLIGLMMTTSTLKKSTLRRYNKNESKQQTEIQNSDKKDIVVTPDKNADEIISTQTRNNNSREEKINRGAVSDFADNPKNKASKENKNGFLPKASPETIFRNPSEISSRSDKKSSTGNIFSANDAAHAFIEKNNSEKISKKILENNSEKISENKINNSGKENTNTDFEKNPGEKDYGNISSITESQINNLFALKLLPLKTGLLTLKNNFVSPCKGPGDGCPTFSSNSRYNPNKGFFVDVLAGPEYITRKLTEKSLDFTDYRTARDTTERPQYAFTAGVGVGYEFRNGIVLRTGVLYSEIHETANFDSLGVGKIEYTITKDPTTGTSDTSAQILTNGIFRKTRYNRYSDINIPLQIGYDIILPNNWSILLKAGVGVNITAWRKADILGTDFKLLNQTSSSATPIFKNNIGGYVCGSIAIYKAVDEHLLLGIEPSVRFYNSSFTQTAYPLTQTYMNFGINASAKLKF